MTKRSYFTPWGAMFILCAGLGFIPEPAGLLRSLMILLAVLFFAPPAALLYFAIRQKDRACITLVRNISAASLGLTVAAIVLNFLCFMAPEAVGNVLYAALVIISAPMVCGQYWVLGLFGWAALLMITLSQLRKIK